MRSRWMLGALALAVVAGRAAAEEAPGAPKPSCCQQTAAAPAATLEAKVAAMNAAQGAQKLDAVAAVVNELATQHLALHQAGAKQQGCCGGDCPMMKKPAAPGDGGTP